MLNLRPIGDRIPEHFTLTLLQDSNMAKRALLSVSDKTGIIEFAKGLQALDFRPSTGGTAKHLRDNDIPVTDVSDVTHP